MIISPSSFFFVTGRQGIPIEGGFDQGHRVIQMGQDGQVRVLSLGNHNGQAGAGPYRTTF